MGLFFGTFEFVKQQCYYAYIGILYGKPGLVSSYATAGEVAQVERNDHYLSSPAFLLLAGFSASFAHSTVHYRTAHRS